MRFPLEQSGYLEGQLLIATPMIGGDYFNRSVVYLCMHNAQGAMGFIINSRIENVRFQELLEQLEITAPPTAKEIPVHLGGPLEPGRGFILHSTDQPGETHTAPGPVALSCSTQMLSEIASGRGPAQSMLTLGYAGWAAGQLESEIEAGAWLSVPATPELIFSGDNESKWALAGLSQGVDFGRFSNTIGHA